MTINRKDVPATTSLNVAKCFFGKRHDRVLRAIRNLGCSEEFAQCNFTQSSYVNEQGKEQPMYVMTRDGFLFLIMSSNNREDGQIKEVLARSTPKTRP